MCRQGRSHRIRPHIIIASCPWSWDFSSTKNWTWRITWVEYYRHFYHLGRLRAFCCTLSEAYVGLGLYCSFFPQGDKIFWSTIWLQENEKRWHLAIFYMVNGTTEWIGSRRFGILRLSGMGILSVKMTTRRHKKVLLSWECYVSKPQACCLLSLS